MFAVDASVAKLRNTVGTAAGHEDSYELTPIDDRIGQKNGGNIS